VKPSLLEETIYDWKKYLSLTPSEEDIRMLQRHERTGRPLGNESFLTRFEKSLGRLLKPKKPDRKANKSNK
jgi:putative transposase